MTNHNYYHHMKIFTLLLISIILSSIAADKILAILDNKAIEDTHSSFFNMLRKEGDLEIAYSSGRSKIELKYYDKFRYDHIIVMCTSTKGIFLSIQKYRAKSKSKISYPISILEEMLLLSETLTHHSPSENSSTLLVSN